jgi:hypothetical protein
MEWWAGVSGRVRFVALSAGAALLAPLVFLGIIVMRKAERRFSVHARVWGKRLRNEIGRWN